MPKTSYIPGTDAGKADFLDNLATKLPTHTVILDITPAQITWVTDDAAMFNYIMDMQEVYKTFKQKVSGYKNFLRDGELDPPKSLPVPVPPTLAAPPTVVNQGIFRRIRKLVNLIKAHHNYSDLIGEDLGIVGDEETVELNKLKPILTSEIVAGHPVIKWTKGVAESLDIYVDRNDGAGEVFLATDTHPDYTDTFPLPAGVKSGAWDYKAIYKIGDDQVGKFSDKLRVAVSK